MGGRQGGWKGGRMKGGSWKDGMRNGGRRKDRRRKDRRTKGERRKGGRRKGRSTRGVNLLQSQYRQHNLSLPQKYPIKMPSISFVYIPNIFFNLKNHKLILLQPFLPIPVVLYF